MPGTVYHVFTNNIADGTNTNIVRPSDWNSSHALTYAAAGSELSGAFSNLNGISFGTEAGGGMTASYTVPVTTAFLTTAMASNRGSDFVAATAAFAGTSASGTIASNGISVSIGPYITTAMLSNAATISNVRVSAGTTSNLLSAITFSNSNGITFGLNASTLTASHDGLTTARASNDAIGLNTAQTNVTWTANSAGLSLDAGGYAGTVGAITGGSITVNTAGVSVNLPAYLTTAMASNAATISNIKVSAGTLSANRSDITFANSNNVSFGLNTNGVITASAPNAGAVNFSAGTTSSALDSVVFSNSNGVSFGLNGSTVTASVVAGGGVTITQFLPTPLFSGTAFTSEDPTSVIMQPVMLPFDLAFSGVQVLKNINMTGPGATSQASTGTNIVSYSHGLTIFKPVNNSNSSTQITTVASGSLGITAGMSYSRTSLSIAVSWVTDTTGGTTALTTTSNNTAWVNSVVGLGNAGRILQIPLVTTLTPGIYFVGHQHSTTAGTTGSNMVFMSISDLHVTAPAIAMGSLGVAYDAYNPHGHGMNFVEGGGHARAASSLIITSTTFNRGVLSTGSLRARFIQFVNKAIP